jgi:site-specific recombinase XerC
MRPLTDLEPRSGEREIPGGSALRKRTPENESNANEQRIGPIIAVRIRRSLQTLRNLPLSLSKLAPVASFFDHLCEANAVSHNPVRGVKRPKAEGNEGKTPALGDGELLSNVVYGVMAHPLGLLSRLLGFRRFEAVHKAGALDYLG